MNDGGSFDPENQRRFNVVCGKGLRGNHLSIDTAGLLGEWRSEEGSRDYR